MTGPVAAVVAVALSLAGCLPEHEPPPTPTAAATAEALDPIEALAVAAEHTGPGYDRGHWEHRSGHLCDTPGTDPYTAAPYTPDQCDVDHIVSAREAWESGGWQWTPEQQRQFGRWQPNLTPSLDCVNRSKGAGDTAEWAGTVRTGPCSGLTTTPEGLCWWAATTTTTKTAWGLTADPAEHNTLTQTLQTCPPPPTP